jgi:hypothetical protein
MLTKWTNEVVAAVLRGELNLPGLQREPYFVNEQGMTGGPVIRGPWGSIGGRSAQWAEYEAKCKQFNAACVHGQLLERRRICELDACCDLDVPADVKSTRCARCGGIS